VPSRPDRKRQGGPSAELEAWLALIARVLVFLLGVAILTWQLVATHDHDRVLELIAVALMAPLVGPILVTGLVQLLLALRGQEARP
jgi:ABC-type molybdate transport system permease subunit